MKQLTKIFQEKLITQKFDCWGVGVFNLNSSDIFFFESSKKIFFDLASLSKPLTLGVLYLENEKLFDEKLLSLLEHRAGLPSHGRLDQKTWKETILSYPIKQAETLYSDYSALRLMLELEKKMGVDLKKRVSKYWDEELLFWKDLKGTENTPVSGERGGHIISGEVQDDNAFVINDFVVHAGMFGTVEGLCKTLININQKLELKDKIFSVLSSENSERFVRGWDRSKGKNSLAGEGCSDQTIGHLGFTGTSFWIDLKSGIGYVFLTNYTKYCWYERTLLNNLRREIGTYIWKNFR